MGARWNLGHAYQGLGAVARAQGKHEHAVDMFRKCVDTFTELGGRFYAAHGLAEMDPSLFALGNSIDAERAWHESLRIATEIHGIPVALYALIGLASLLAKRGDIEHALELTLIVSNHPASSHDTRNRATHLRAELETQLTPQQVADAHTQMKSFDQVVRLVLGTNSAPSPSH